MENRLPWVGKIPIEALIAVAVLGAAIAASGSEIAGRSEYEPYTPIVLTVDHDYEVQTGEDGLPIFSVSIAWRVAPPVKYLDAGDGQSIHVWAPPGTYQIEAFLRWIDWEKRQSGDEFIFHDFKVLGKPIPPVPDPDPDPPKPQLAATHLVTVRETRDTTPAEASLLARIQRERPGGLRVLNVDDDTQDVMRPFAELAEGKPKPYMMLVHQRPDQSASDLVWQGPLPDRYEDVLKIVEENK